jgi:N6-adenosine-specific RNA methylase IME4
MVGMKYEIIYIDPPWPRTPCGTAKTPYKTMMWQELHAFDLGQFMARDCVVFCWLTGPTHLKECAVLSTWCERFKLYEAGIAYRWIKTTKAGVPIGASGPRPKLVKQLGEDVIALTTARRGRVFSLLTEAQVQWCEDDGIVDACEVLAPKVPRGEHSRKPAIVRDKIVELLGNRPRIEVFARARTAGWHSHGDELPALTFPVTDDLVDAPDGSVVDGYERVGDLWVWQDTPTWERQAA